MKKTFVVLLALLTACASPATPPTPEVVTVQYSSSTQARVPDLYTCASEIGVALSIEIRATDFFDPSAQLWIRLGEPDEIPSTAYEIGTDEIVVVAHPDNPIHSLTLADIRALFSGEIRNWDELGSKDMPVQVWAFGPSEDIRQIFDATVMLQQPISSEAHLALNTDSMATGVGSEPGATGFLPRSLVKPDIQIVNIDQLSSSIIVPVLAFTAPDADDATMTLVACMQNK